MLSIIIFFIFIRNNDYLKNNAIRLSADVNTYYKISEMSFGTRALISLRQNLLGPILFIIITRKNLLFAFFINILLFLIALHIFLKSHRSTNFDKKIFIKYILLNPLIFVSLLLINKELFSFVSILFFLSYLKENKKTYLFIALTFAIFTRWQQLIVYIIFLFFNSPVYLFKGKNRLTILLIILFINTFFNSIFSIFSNIYAQGTLESQLDKAGQLMKIIYFCENNFLYLVSLPIKIFLNLFGNIFRVFYLFNPSYILADVYNNLFILGHQISFFIIFYIMFLKKKLNLSNNIFFLSMIICILFSISKMIQYRYFLIVYVLWVYILSNKDNKQRK